MERESTNTQHTRGFRGFKIWISLEDIYRTQKIPCKGKIDREIETNWLSKILRMKESVSKIPNMLIKHRKNGLSSQQLKSIDDDIIWNEVKESIIN